MTTTRQSGGRAMRSARVLAVGAAAVATLVLTGALSGFFPQAQHVGTGDEANKPSEVNSPAIIGIRTFEAPPGIRVNEDIVYGTREDGTLLTLDVCQPAPAQRAAGTSEATAEDPSSTATPAAPEASSDATPDTTSDATPDTTSDATPDTTSDASPDATSDATPHTTSDATPDTAQDAAPDATTAARAAVISIHGGSWARGDKANADWRNVCLWLASEGFVAYSVNYRLVPDVAFPAALNDVALAVEWMRQPANAESYAIDPARIGAFGGSAGGNLAAMLGARGEGSLDTGSRVAAVAELSAPLDLSRRGQVDGGAPAGVQRAVLDYLGCGQWILCDKAAEAASATTELDPSDPPVFIGHGDAEMIPVAQAIDYAAELARAGVDHELAIVPSIDHSIGILDEPMRARVADFLRRALARD